MCVAALVGLCPSSQAQQTVPYFSGFETPVYNPGQAPGEGWEFDAASSVTVQSQVVYEADASLAIGRGGSADQPITSVDPVIWIDAYQRGAPTDDLPELTDLTSGSAIVTFHNSGLLCLDGDNNGSGVWTATGVDIDPGDWYRLTLRLDYGASTYDCHVNGALVLSGLGFLYDETTMLNGLRASSGDVTSYLDLVSVSTTRPSFLDETIPPPDPSREFGFDLTEQGWLAIDLFTDQTLHTTSTGQIELAAPSFFVAGAWEKRGIIVDTEPDSVYELRWEVASEQALTSEVPWLRCRTNTALRGQVANVMNVLSPQMGGFAPDSGGAVYQQALQLPPEVAAAGLNLSFDILQFNADDQIGAQIQLRNVQVVRHDASQFAGGTLIANYHFRDDAQGWTFEPWLGVPPMTGIVVAGSGLVLLSGTNLLSAASWRGPGTPMALLPKLYRVDFGVSATHPGGDCPSMRLRVFDETNGMESIELQTTAVGDKTASPGLPKTYSAYMFAPTGMGLDGSTIGVAMDMLNITPNTDPTGAFTLHSARVYELGP